MFFLSEGTFLFLLAPDNNPGWYLPEDDGTGGVSIQRRNMPLLKDSAGLFLLNQKTTVRRGGGEVLESEKKV